jgi:hypothetical protein
MPNVVVMVLYVRKAKKKGYCTENERCRVTGGTKQATLNSLEKTGVFSRQKRTKVRGIRVQRLSKRVVQSTL